MKIENTAPLPDSLIAILRGLKPEQAIPVAYVLIDAGFRIIEVPLNSPEPLESIRAVAKKYGNAALVGAGTVLSTDDVEQVVNAGGRLIVAPNLNLKVGSRAKELGAVWCPGVTTTTEAFTALDAGADVLKFFPAENIPPVAIRAMRSVLPMDCVIAPVGGITPDTMDEYLAAGANSFGLGSALFKPYYTIDEIRERAIAFVNAFNRQRRT